MLKINKIAINFILTYKLYIYSEKLIS